MLSTLSLAWRPALPLRPPHLVVRRRVSGRPSSVTASASSPESSSPAASDTDNTPRALPSCPGSFSGRHRQAVTFRCFARWYEVVVVWARKDITYCPNVMPSTSSCPQFALPRTTECLISFLKALAAAPNERTRDRVGYRAGHYPRSLVTRVGKLELRVTRDRDGRFSTELFERFQRSEQALVSALAFARQPDLRTIRKPPAGSCSRHPRRRCAVRCPTPQPVPAPGRRTRGARRIARRGGNVRHRVPRTASRRRAAA